MKTVDMHCDTIYELRKGQKKGERISLRENHLHLDLMKMKQGDYLLQNFALFVNLTQDPPLAEALELMDLFYQEMEANQDMIRPVRCWKDIEENQRNGVMSALLTLEEGEISEGDPGVLQMLCEKGARMMTLTWNYENRLAWPNGMPDPEKGLKEAGFRILEEMEKLSMIVDVSHLSDQGFWDVISHTKKPFVASHSNARSLCGHYRNLTDEMIRALAQRGGVIGLNFYPYFLMDESNGRTPVCTVEALVRHAKHIVNIGGMECLGLGTDYDGISGELEIKDGSQIMLLYDALCRNGFTQDQADAVFGGNVLRLYKEIL